MAQCAVVGCKQTWYPSSSVSFHKVTKNDKILPLWLRVADMRLPKYAKICSLHFRPQDFEDRTGLRRLRWDAVPSLNVHRGKVDDSDEDTDDEDGDDNKNLSILKKLLTSDSKTGPTATQEHDYDDSNDEGQPQKFEMVMSGCNSTSCNPNKRAGLAKPKQMTNTAVQANRVTNREIALRHKVKVLDQRLRRREAKLSYMKTVFNMIKKHVKGTDMEYKLSCELQNISEFTEPIANKVTKARNTKQTKPESPVSERNNDDDESSDDGNAMCFEVTLSPNLISRNGV